MEVAAKGGAIVLYDLDLGGSGGNRAAVGVDCGGTRARLDQHDAALQVERGVGGVADPQPGRRAEQAGADARAVSEVDRCTGVGEGGGQGSGRVRRAGARKLADQHGVATTRAPAVDAAGDDRVFRMGGGRRRTGWYPAQLHRAAVVHQRDGRAQWPERRLVPVGVGIGEPVLVRTVEQVAGRRAHRHHRR